jgi:hypothetical protein
MDAELWYQATDDEMASLRQLEVFEVVDPSEEST